MAHASLSRKKSASVMRLDEDELEKQMQLQEELTRKLIKAVNKGDKLEVIADLLKQGAELDGIDGDGQTPLIIAVQRGHADIVDFLVDRAGASLKAKDKDGKTPLIWAVQKGHLYIVQRLVEKRVKIQQSHLARIVQRGNVNAHRDRNGKTALMYAAIYGRREIADFLITRANVDVNAKDENDRTALIFAASYHNFDVAQLLVQCGAKIDCKSSTDGVSALTLAARNGDIKTAELLLNCLANVNCSENTGKTPFICASVNGHGNLAAIFVKQGANFYKAATSDGSTPETLANDFKWPFLTSVHSRFD